MPVDDSNTRVSKRARTTTSLPDALIEVQRMKFRDLAKQLEVDRASSRRIFELEMKQRDQHHEEIKFLHDQKMALMKTQHEQLKMQHEQMKMQYEQMKMRHEATIEQMKMRHEVTMMQLKIDSEKVSRKTVELDVKRLDQ